MFFLIRKLIEKYPRQSQRVLEILPGFTSWNLILFPIWGSIFWPIGVAYFIIAFNVYWLYRSSISGLGAVLSYYRIQAAEKYDWMGDVREFPDWREVKHVIVMPTYKEPGEILVRTLEALKNQTLGAKQIIPVIAMEERAGKEINESRVKMIEENFKGVFEKIIYTYHPANIAGEVVGKSSNAAWAGLEIRKELKRNKHWNIEKMTITSLDCDVALHPNHLAALTFNFLDDPHRYTKIWQGAIVFYNNIERIPWPMRVFNRMNSILCMAQMFRSDRMINFSTYSLSLKLMDGVDYWDTDVIPEDYRIFFKTYFATKGQVEVEPLYITVSADAAEAEGFWNTYTNTYEQVKRWAWGASDDAYILKRYFLDTEAPFWDKTIRVLKVVEDHFMWPVNWFIITIGANMPPLLNQTFSRTVMGKTLPQVSSAILTISLVSLAAMLFIDIKARPKVKLPWWRKLLSPFEFVLLPITGFFFSALPGLDAHTRLMMGKYLEYRVTEKKA